MTRRAGGAGVGAGGHDASWRTDRARQRDDEVVARAREGDAEAWRELYRAHGARLVMWLGLRSAADAAVDAEDVAAEAWLVAAGKLPEFAGTSSDFAGWLFGIARHVAANHARKAARRSASFPDAGLPGERSEVGPDTDIPGHDWVRRVLATLPPREREVVGCVDVLGLSTEAAAQALGISTVAVRVTRHRALRRLRAALETPSAPHLGLLTLSG